MSRNAELRPEARRKRRPRGTADAARRAGGERSAAVGLRAARRSSRRRRNCHASIPGPFVDANGGVAGDGSSHRPHRRTGRCAIRRRRHHRDHRPNCRRDAARSFSPGSATRYMAGSYPQVVRLPTVVLDGPPGRRFLAIKALRRRGRRARSHLLAAIQALAQHEGVAAALAEERRLSQPEVSKRIPRIAENARKGWRWDRRNGRDCSDVRQCGDRRDAFVSRWRMLSPPRGVQGCERYEPRGRSRRHSRRRNGHEGRRSSQGADEEDPRLAPIHPQRSSPGVGTSPRRDPYRLD